MCDEMPKREIRCPFCREVACDTEHLGTCELCRVHIQFMDMVLEKTMEAECEENGHVIMIGHKYREE